MQLTAEIQATNELLPCPFCGMADALEISSYPIKGMKAVQCMRCGCIGPGEYGGLEVRSWNRRTPAPQPLDLSEHLSSERLVSVSPNTLGAIEAIVDEPGNATWRAIVKVWLQRAWDAPQPQPVAPNAIFEALSKDLFGEPVAPDALADYWPGNEYLEQLEDGVDRFSQYPVSGEPQE